MACSGCAARREAIARVGAKIVAGVKAALALPVVKGKGEDAGRRLIKSGLKRRK